MGQASEFGFNVISHVSGNLGIGVTARNVLRVLIERGCPVAVLDLDPGLGRHGHDRSYDAYKVDSIQDMPYGINLFILPPSTVSNLLPQALTLKPGCLNAAWSMWELPVLPDVWARPLEALDVLIAQSEFIRYAFEFNLSHVHTIAGVHPLYLPEEVRADRARFGLPEADVIFVTSFDPHSDPQRKNPFAAVRAFLDELGAEPRAHLAIKLNNADARGDMHPVVEELLALCAGHPRVHLLTESLSYAEVLGLYASGDVFVSLHRAEGLGLGPMEAMALGKPVIATAWSGNMTYMNHGNACPVGYRLIPVDGSIADYSSTLLRKEALWADPDPVQAGAWMRRLFEDAALRERIGARAREDIARHQERARAGGFIDEVRAVWEHQVQLAARATTDGACRAVVTQRSERMTAYLLWHADMMAKTAYASWRERHALIEQDSAPARPAASAGILFDVIVRMRAGLEALLADSVDSLGAQDHPDYRLTVLADAPVPEGFEQNERLHWVCAGTQPLTRLNELVARTPAPWVLYLDAGDRLAPRLLSQCAAAITWNPQWQLLYTDEDRIADNGEHGQPNFKPDCNPDLLRATPYIGRACLVRRAAWVEVGGCAPLEGAEYHDLALKLLERHGEAAIGHVADMLFHQLEANAQRVAAAQLRAHNRSVVQQHLARCGCEAAVNDGLTPDSFCVEYRHDAAPHVTVIIPTRDRLDMLRPCLESLLRATTWPHFDVMVVNNASREQATLDYLAQLTAADSRVTVLDWPGEYNFAAINNAAARQARGEYLLLLNNDTVIVQPNWLAHLMAHGQRPEVGAVGARLVYPNRTVQHAGIILGMGAHGVAEHVFIGLPMNAPGYQGRALQVQNLSAVTAACMLIRKSAWFEAGGMDDQHFKVMYNDVDLCLKLREHAYRIVWTPYATLIHHGSASLKQEADPAKEERARAEVYGMYEKWLPQLARDPAFNRNLSLQLRHVMPDLDMPVSWNDQSAPRTRVIGFGLGSDGSWRHRVVAPLQALARAGRADCALMPKYRERIRIPSMAELARMDPDILLLHNTVHDSHLAGLELYKRFSRAFRVFGADDLMFALPDKNPFQKTVYRDMKKRMRTCLSLCDRLVVTTEPLAQVFKDMIGDVRIVPNYLEQSRWGQLRSLRRQGVKPRVGWAGATQHQGDLELIAAVVKETAREVDWVFFGMCPPQLRPYVREFHAGVSFDAYPEKLAGLNLDLAVAPLEHNRFNEAKSNLRLLEYGMMGWPVVCSNIYPYQDAPVERVANNPRAWLNAIRARINDLDAAVIEGERLRRWVLENWMLEDHLDAWLGALSPDTDLAVPARDGTAGV